MSDVIISSQSTNPRSVSLPARETRTQLLVGNHKLAGLVQKMLIRNNTMIQWAGSYVTARQVTKQILASSHDGRDCIDLISVINKCDLSAHKRDNLSIIYLHNQPDDLSVTYGNWGCQKVDYINNEWIITAGSGVFSFFSDLLYEHNGNHPSHIQIRHEILSKVLFNYVLEMFGEETLSHLYGGWFEIAYRTGSSFAKLPYAIKLWSCDGETLGSGGPGFFGWYYNRNLVVSRYQPTELAGRKELKIRHHWIQDYLDLDDIMLDTPPDDFRSKNGATLHNGPRESTNLIS